MLLPSLEEEGLKFNDDTRQDGVRNTAQITRILTFARVPANSLIRWLHDGREHCCLLIYGPINQRHGAQIFLAPPVARIAPLHTLPAFPPFLVPPHPSSPRNSVLRHILLSAFRARLLPSLLASLRHRWIRFTAHLILVGTRFESSLLSIFF